LLLAARHGVPVTVSAGVDVGGTFTDVVVHAEGYRPRAVKVPTTPGNQAEGVERGVQT
jgi:N-methylhydantoinase A